MSGGAPGFGAPRPEAEGTPTPRAAAQGASPSPAPRRIPCAPALLPPESLAPLTELRVHLGAHKTASTHLQTCLGDARAVLLDAGLDAVPRALLRTTVTPLRHPSRPEGRRVGPGFRRAVQEALAPLRLGPGRLILSEENLLGPSDWPLRRPPYWAAPFFLRPVLALERGGGAEGARVETRFFLALRSFDGLLPAAYAQRLRQGAPWPAPFETIRRRAAARPPSWLPLLRMLRIAAPRAQVTIWSHDDYRAHGHAIREALCGVPLPPAHEPADPPNTRTPSAAAVAWAAALPASMPRETRKTRTMERFHASIAGAEPRWEPFSPEEKARLRARFEQDLAEIERRGLAVRLRF